MNAKCPNCGTQIDWREHARSTDLVEMIELLPVFGPDHKQVFEYVELFGISPLSLKTKKCARLLREMAALYRTGTFTLQKKSYEISRAGIAEALREVCNRQFRSPLTNHNYLKKVMIPISERESKQQRSADERALRRREEKIRQGERPEHDPDFETNLTGVKNALKGIG